MRFHEHLAVAIKILIICCQAAPHGGCLMFNWDVNRPIIGLINGQAAERH